MTGRAAAAALVLTLAAGLLLGLWTAWRVLASDSAPGAHAYGPWTVRPRAGAADADPYSLAAVARGGDIPMTPVEGVALMARRDGEGAPLTTRCRYRIGGSFPPARAWTLALYTPDGRALAGPAGRGVLTSAEALGAEGGMAVSLAAEPQPGNWLPLEGDQRFVVALRLYETPLSAVAASLDARSLPQLQRLGCR